MTLRRRAILIAAGILVFIALGPLIVLMAQGYRYDFKNGHLVVTGTLVVKTEPRGAQVSLNGHAASDTPLAKRFLTPNEYLVEITKTDYRSWRKRVNIFERQVTFLPDQNAKINLLLDRGITLKNIVGVGDIFAYEDLLFYLDTSGKQIFSVSFNRANPQLVASTTGILTNARLTAGRRIGSGTEFIISADEGLFYVSEHRLAALPELSNVQFSASEGTVLGLNAKNQLVQTDPNGGAILQNDVFAYRRNGDQIFYLTKNENGKYFLVRLKDNGNSEQIADVPSFQKAKIISSSNNQIFLLLDRELYSISDHLDKINSQIEFAHWDANGEFLLYGNSHEAWIYDPLAAEQNQLLVRAATPSAAPVFHKAAGYTFIIEGKEIKAVEADRLGQPNVYSLLLATDPKNISLNEEGNILAYLDGETLHMIQIR